MATGVADRGRVVDHTFARNGEPDAPRLALVRRRHRGRRWPTRATPSVDRPGPEVQVVLHPVDAANPRPYRRKNAPTFVVAIGYLAEPPTDLLRTGYPLLVRGLANLAVLLSDGPTAGRVTSSPSSRAPTPSSTRATTTSSSPPCSSGSSRSASSRLVIANEFLADLPPVAVGRRRADRQIARAGERLGALDLLPAAFPIEEILLPATCATCKLLYGIGGLSYGNVERASAAAHGVGDTGPSSG